MRGEVDTSRLEAFSDGVFAISITLLIIGVGIRAEGGSLAYRLAEQGPSYASYVVLRSEVARPLCVSTGRR